VKDVGNVIVGIMPIGKINGNVFHILVNLSINPCCCSERCEKALYDGIGKLIEQRRINADIELYGCYTKNLQLVKNML